MSCNIVFLRKYTIIIPLHTKINVVVSDPGLIAEKDFMKKCTSKLKIY